MTEPQPTLSEIEIRTQLAGLPHWRWVDNHLERRYTTGGWKGSLMVANAIGHLAEAAWHHPDLLVTYPAVTVSLSTHDAGGITAKDFALALRIEALIQWRPEEGPLEGTPDGPRFQYVHHD
ncbi:4a-hydroxytetrahydrobiopterin dehydratase [Gammaproteobacteria bacterium]